MLLLTEAFLEICENHIEAKSPQCHPSNGRCTATELNRAKPIGAVVDKQLYTTLSQVILRKIEDQWYPDEAYSNAPLVFEELDIWSSQATKEVWPLLPRKQPPIFCRAEHCFSAALGSLIRCPFVRRSKFQKIFGLRQLPKRLKIIDRPKGAALSSGSQEQLGDARFHTMAGVKEIHSSQIFSDQHFTNTQEKGLLVLKVDMNIDHQNIRHSVYIKISVHPASEELGWTPRFGKETPAQIVKARKLQARAEAAEKQRREEEREELQALHDELEELYELQQQQRQATMQAWGQFMSVQKQHSRPSTAATTDILQKGRRDPRLGGGSTLQEALNEIKGLGPLKAWGAEDEEEERGIDGFSAIEGDATGGRSDDDDNTRVTASTSRPPFYFEQKGDIIHDDDDDDDDDNDDGEESGEGVGVVGCWLVLKVDYAHAIETQTNIFVEEIVEDLSRTSGIEEKRISIERVGYLSDESDEVQDAAALRMRGRRPHKANRSYAGEESKQHDEDENSAQIYVEFWISRRKRRREMKGSDDHHDEENATSSSSSSVSALHGAVDLLRQSRDAKSVMLTDTIHCVHLVALGSGQAEAYLQIHDEVSRAHRRGGKGNGSRGGDIADKSGSGKMFIPQMTVPKPFKFAATKKAKENTTTSQRNLQEYLLELREEERRNRQRRRFKAKPVPASTFVPKLKRMQEESEQRKATREKILQKKYDDAAARRRKRQQQQADGGSPVINEEDEEEEEEEEEGDLSQRLAQQIEMYNKRREKQRQYEVKHIVRTKKRQLKITKDRRRDIEDFVRTRESGKESKEERQERLQRAAKKYLDQSALPPGLEARMLKRALEKKKKEDEEEAARKAAEEKLKEKIKDEEGAKIGEGSSTSRVPDFKKIHERDERRRMKMAQKRAAERQKTVPMAFKLSKPRKKKAQPQPRAVGKRASFKAESSLRNSNPPKPKLTKSVALKIRETNNKIVARFREEEQRKKELMNSTVAFNKCPSEEMRKAVKQHIKANRGNKLPHAAEIRRKTEQARREAAKSEQEYKRKMKEMKERISKRPLLMLQPMFSMKRSNTITLALAYSAVVSTPLSSYQDKRERDRREARRQTLIKFKKSLEETGVRDQDQRRYFDIEELKDHGLAHWLDKKPLLSRHRRRGRKTGGKKNRNKNKKRSLTQKNKSHQQAQVDSKSSPSPSLAQLDYSTALGAALGALDKTLQSSAVGSSMATQYHPPALLDTPPAKGGETDWGWEGKDDEEVKTKDGPLLLEEGATDNTAGFDTATKVDVGKASDGASANDSLAMVTLGGDRKKEDVLGSAPEAGKDGTLEIPLTEEKNKDTGGADVGTLEIPPADEKNEDTSGTDGGTLEIPSAEEKNEDTSGTDGGTLEIPSAEEKNEDTSGTDGGTLEIPSAEEKNKDTGGADVGTLEIPSAEEKNNETSVTADVADNKQEADNIPADVETAKTADRKMDDDAPLSNSTTAAATVATDKPQPHSSSTTDDKDEPPKDDPIGDIDDEDEIVDDLEISDDDGDAEDYDDYEDDFD
eukprot:jgi/Bigna1/71547/fgenesh1_pg.16_\